jgi:hypothetical protein
MSVTIDGIEFDRVSYDAEADVLYLHIGEPEDAVDFDETPEVTRCASLRMGVSWD